MSNTATAEYVGGYWKVRVNGISVINYGSDQSRAQTVANRLQRIFEDLNRDLDFITPTIVNGYYALCCPKVRMNVGERTYLYDPVDAAYYPEKLYEPTNWQDSTTPAEQTAIATILSTDQPNQPPWVTALEYSNNIRGAINLNFNDAVGRSQCQNLYVPSNVSNSVASVISNSARCDVYGVPCQGTQPGKQSDCPELGFPAENIANMHTGSFTGTEVFHPQDLTAALTSSNNWYSNYKGKFIKVTNISNGMWVVVRVTDQAPAGRGVELAYRPWVQIGRPLGSGTVKIELMG
ncbi:MAG: hypothetical protein ACPLQP_05875 [Moorellaceae bacterium]